MYNTKTYTKECGYLLIECKVREMGNKLLLGMDMQDFILKKGKKTFTVLIKKGKTFTVLIVFTFRFNTKITRYFYTPSNIAVNYSHVLAFARYVILILRDVCINNLSH